MPEVSVIMNCYNGEKFLEQSINSVINQTFKNWELIFWDNKSSDQSKKIFKKFNDKRLKYFYSNIHTNLYEARNKAILKSRGKILTFLDVDDIWLTDKLEKQVKIFKTKKKINLVYSNYFIKKKFLYFEYKKLAKNFKLPSGYIINDLLKNYFIGLLTIAIRKNSLKNKYKVFDSNLNYVADFAFILNFSLKNKFYGIQKPLAIYRLHSNQQQKKFFFPQAEDFCNLYNKLEKNKIFYRNNNFKFLKEKNFFCSNIIKIKKENLFRNFIYFLKIKKIKLKIKLILILFFRKVVINNFLKVY